MQQVVISSEADREAALQVQLDSFAKKHVQAEEKVPAFLEKIGAGKLVKFQRGGGRAVTCLPAFFALAHMHAPVPGG